MSDSSNYTTTRLESVADIRSWATRQQQEAPPKEELSFAPTTSEAKAFRPVRRPLMALLTILDDDGKGGETIRVRQDKIVVGRTEGDILIHHDEGISARHFELFRTSSHGRWRWYIRDLKSTNGTFARVASAQLRNRQEVLLGSRRFCLMAGRPAPAAPVDERQGNSTRPWEPVTPDEVAQRQGSLVEILPQGLGQSYSLSDGETWIGTDAATCAIAIEDPFLSQHHAKIFRDAQGHWCIQNSGSQNGTWLRVDKLAVETSGEFQAGEQRFLIRVDQP